MAIACCAARSRRARPRPGPPRRPFAWPATAPTATASIEQWPTSRGPERRLHRQGAAQVLSRQDSHRSERRLMPPIGRSSQPAGHRRPGSLFLAADAHRARGRSLLLAGRREALSRRRRRARNSGLHGLPRPGRSRRTRRWLSGSCAHSTRSTSWRSSTQYADDTRYYARQQGRQRRRTV